MLSKIELINELGNFFYHEDYRQKTYNHVYPKNRNYIVIYTDYPQSALRIWKYGEIDAILFDMWFAYDIPLIEDEKILAWGKPNRLGEIVLFLKAQDGLKTLFE
jgi:hypothetical protein